MEKNLEKLNGSELPENDLDEATGGASFYATGAVAGSMAGAMGTSSRSTYSTTLTVKYRCQNEACANVWEASDSLLGSICPDCGTKGDKIG